jgi:hypothetical protein
MSIRVMSMVWSKAPVQGGELLILLALADNADDNGNAYPGVPYIASKARMTDRNVQLCIRKLADGGYLKISPNAGPSGANKYKIDLDLLGSLPDDFTPTRKPPAGGENISPPTNCHPVKSAPQGVKNNAPGGEAHFTLTVIEPPVEEPLSAHARSREALSENVSEENNKRSSSRTFFETVPDENGSEADPKAVKREFQRFVNNWPGFAGLSLRSAEAEFSKLSADDRRAAEARRDQWIAMLRKQGKDHTPAPSTYLRERLWEGVPDVSEVVSASHAKPFGKAWMAHVLEQLAAPAATLPPAPAFIAKQIADGTPIGKAEQRNRLARHGWPKVNFMFHQAYEGKGCCIAPDLLERLPEMEALAIDSPAYHQWQTAFAERGWPWLKLPEGLRFVWFPKGGPGGEISHHPVAGPPQTSTPCGPGRPRTPASDTASKTDLTTLTKAPDDLT